MIIYDLQSLVDSFEEPVKTILTLRYLKDKTQQEVADALKIDRRFISRIEKIAIQKIEK